MIVLLCLLEQRRRGGPHDVEIRPAVQRDCGADGLESV